MRIMNMYYKNIALLIIFMLSLSMFSQETLTKEIKESFEMTNAGELHINNKYGKIAINGWEKDNIEIVISVKVSNKKKKNAKSLIDRIEPNFRIANNYVSVISEISDKNTSLFSRYFNKVNPFEFDKGNVEINFTVYLPINAELDITNKFGDVIIENWTGKLNANIEHGDLWINESIVNANVEMKFGKLRTKSMTYGTISLKNGSIDIEESQDLVLKTSGADIEIDKVNTLKFTSSKDEARIGYIERLEGDIRFSNIEVEEIGKNIDLTMKVADFKVLRINQEDAQVTINQESSDISINISQLSFKFDATLEQGLLRLSKSFYNIKNNVLDEEKRLRNIKASFGATLTGTFTFTGKKGVITLKE
ncbi:hypothetical protein [Pontimicrobium sp. SW4]|uniref:Adhesin domain-containing protein n=1 Tax=Pontimicrobium sp. SW4 TaxID=3153519 RepID=A0AAU7BX16_9FLAO